MNEDDRGKRIFEYMRDSVLHPEEHPEHWEDWLRTYRRRRLLLTIIYYLQHVQGKENGVTKEDLEVFLGRLYYVDDEMFFSIIKPWKPLEDTLQELLEIGLVLKTPGGVYLVNPEKVRDVEDLRYWNSIKGVLDRVSGRGTDYEY
jgi:hypothetical protein